MALAARISEEIVEQVKTSADIVDIVSEYVKLKQSGRSYKGLCPFHDERTPSFNVNPDEQYFHCFGCGKGGDVFSFLMEIEGLSFTEVVLRLARRCGITVEQQELTPEQKAVMEKRRQLLYVHELASQFYKECLLSKRGRAARGYLRRREMDGAGARRYGLGYAPDGWQNTADMLKQAGIPLETGVEAGILMPGKNGAAPYDRFRNRIMFPIHNERGQVIAFGGRILTDAANGPKYLNSPETLLFHKGRNLYGWHLARAAIRREESVILVEGYTDVIALAQAGIENVVASLGTSLTEQQAAVLKKATDKAYIAFDADAAGEAATLRGLDLLQGAGLSVRVIELSEGEDPDTFVRSYGPDVFMQRLKEAVPLTKYRLNMAMAGVDPDNISEKVEAVKRILPVLAGISSPVERVEYIRFCAGELLVTEESLVQELEQYKENRGRKNRTRNILAKNRYTKSSTRSQRNRSLNRMRSQRKRSGVTADRYLVEKALLMAVLSKPVLAEHVFNQVRPEFFSHPLLGELAEFLAGPGSKQGASGDDIREAATGRVKMTIQRLVQSGGLLTPDPQQLDEYINCLYQSYVIRNMRFLEKELGRVVDQAGHSQLTTAALNDLLLEYKDLRDALKERKELYAT